MLRRTRAGCAEISCPATQARPEVGGRRVVSILIMVLLPAPFGPTRPKISPGRTAMETASTAPGSPERRVSAAVRIAALDTCAPSAACGAAALPRGPGGDVNGRLSSLL